MKIYETAVRKPISTILIFVGVIVFGLFSLNNLAVDHISRYRDARQIAVITSYAGANAADIETNITRVLEDNLNTVENLKKMTSKSSDNFSMITLEFEYGYRSRRRRPMTSAMPSSRVRSRCCPTTWITRRLFKFISRR